MGLDPTGAQLIKFTNNAVFTLASAPVVVRIPRSQSVGARVNKVIAVARWLAEHDMPSVRLLKQIRGGQALPMSRAHSRCRRRFCSAAGSGG